MGIKKTRVIIAFMISILMVTSVGFVFADEVVSDDLIEEEGTILSEESYIALFEESGKEVPDNASFGTKIVCVENEENIEAACMVYVENESVNMSIVLNYEEDENGNSYLIDVEQAAEDICTPLASTGQGSGSKYSVTVTASWYYMKKSDGSIYLYRPYKLWFVSSVQQNVVAVYETAGCIYSTSGTDLKDENIHTIKLTASPAEKSREYSVTQTSSYFYQVNTGSIYRLHRIRVTAGSNKEATIELVKGSSPSGVA